MNKELIKQLEGVGFKRYDHLLQLDQEDINNETITFFMNLSTDNFYCEYNIKDCDIFAPTFPQILAAIKEHTGVDLTKKTKREEIEELKVKVASLEDAIKSQNEAIEGLKNCVAPTKHKYFFGVDYGNTSDCIDAISYAMQAEEKKGFKVGDRVVKKGDGNYFGDGVKLIIKGKKTDHNYYWCQSESMPSIEKYVHERNLLEHAPKETPKEKALEFGKYAEIIEGHPSKTSYCKGVDVLVIDDTDKPNVTVVMNGHYPVDIHESHLKPL